MNKQPSTLLPAGVINPPANTGINGTIDKYILRPGIGYLTGAHILSTQDGPWGVPYWMQGIAMQTFNNQTITAPTPWQKDIQYHLVGQLSTAGQYGIGTAPTSGVYTGVEDSCG